MITGISIEIDKFDDAAMVNDPNNEIVRILKQIMEDIDMFGLETINSLQHIRDSNGNIIGKIQIGRD